MNTEPQNLKPEQMPAFPLHDGDVWGGMTLRDYFAAEALSAMAKNYGGNTLDFIRDCAPEMAQACYIMADAMLAARLAVCDAK